LIIKQLAF